MNKFKDKMIRFISLFTDRKLFVGKEVTIINTIPIKRNKKISRVSNSITPIYKVKENVGCFELYGTTRTALGDTAYKLIHVESKTNLKLSEKMFNLLFEKVK